MVFGPARAEAAIHLSAAKLHHAAGELDQAETAYRATLALDPQLIGALLPLGTLLADSRRSSEAIALFERIAAADPAHADARHFLGSAWANLGDANQAEHWYRACLKLQPAHGPAQRALGNLLTKLDRIEEAKPFLEAAVALQPSDARARLDLGTLLAQVGETEAARAQFARAYALQPVLTAPTSRGKPAFSVLFLWAPSAANTPVHYLSESAPYDAHFAMLVDGEDPFERLRGYDGIVFNLLCDADHAPALLQRAGDLIDRLGRPAINHPGKIAATGRDAIAAALAGIDGCRVPAIRRQSSDELAALARATATFDPPVLVRRAGSHGGNAFELIADGTALARFIATHPAPAFYLSEYVDTRSADGYFRKYRAIFVAGETLPYHLAIGEHWKVHHFRTDMAKQDWMQREEEAFLRAPETVLTSRHFAVLAAIQTKLDLDFCGVDFALDSEGKLVVFEANAAMLVQPDDSKFAYKAAANAAVKAAFNAMLAKTAAPRR